MQPFKNNTADLVQYHNANRELDIMITQYSKDIMDITIQDVKHTLIQRLFKSFTYTTDADLTVNNLPCHCLQGQGIGFDNQSRLIMYYFFPTESIVTPPIMVGFAFTEKNAPTAKPLAESILQTIRKL